MKSLQFLRVFVCASMLCFFCSMAFGEESNALTFNCVADGTISMSPTSINFPNAASGSGGFTVSVSQTCGFNVSTLQNWVHPSPAGLQIPFTVDANPDLCSRTGSITAQIIDSTGARGAQASGNIFQPGASGDFFVSSTPTTQSVLQGHSVSYAITITKTGGFSGNVGLSVSGVPSGVTASLSNVTQAGATLTLAAASNATVGSFSGVTVTGTNSCQSRQALLSLTIQPSLANAVYYISTNQHVFELFESGTSWTNGDVTAATGNVLAGTSAGLTTFTLGGGHATYYIGANQHVYELFWNGSRWTNGDVTVATNAPLALSTSGLTSFVFNSGAHATYYVGSNQHVYELFWNGITWTNGDITAATNAPLASGTSGLTSFVFSSGAHAIYYIGSNQHVYEFFWNGTTWTNGDITAVTGNTLAAAGSGLTSFLDPSGAHAVYYIGANQHVYELFWNGATWTNGDVTAATGNTLAAVNSSISCFNSTPAHVVYYLGANQHVYELFWNGTTWTNGDVTAVTGNVSASVSSGVASFLAQGGAHGVYFVGTDQHIRQMLWNGVTWVMNDATASTGTTSLSLSQSALALF